MLETLLKRMIRTPFWKSDSAEVLSRTFLDIVLLDRLEAHQEELAARSYRADRSDDPSKKPPK
jgi:hypothetical protein